MSSLMQYKVNTGGAEGALVPVAGAFNNPGNSLQTELPPPSLIPSVPSSQLSGWLTSGYLGDFLGWVGEKLADFGSDLFPAPSVVERQKMMRVSKRHLEQLLTEKMLNENVNSVEFSQVLNSYFHHGLVLIKAIVTPEIWTRERGRV